MFGRQWFESLCGRMFYVLLMVSVGNGKTIYVNAGAGLGGDQTGSVQDYLAGVYYYPWYGPRAHSTSQSLR